MNQFMWNVFVSHSTRSGIGSKAEGLLKRIAAEFGGSSYELFIDNRKIKAGDLWRKKIDKGVAMAHAAIVLLDERALKSKWVRYEASALVYRHGVNGLPIFPVLVDIRPSEMSDRRKDPCFQALGGMQPIEYSTEDEVISSLRERLQDLPGDMCAEELNLIREMAECLPKDPDRAQKIVQVLLGEDHEHVPPRFNVHEQLVYRLREQRLSWEMMNVLRENKAYFREPVESQLRILAERLETSWIDAGKGRPHLPPAGVGRCTIVVGPCAGDIKSAEHYIRQVTYWAPDHQIVDAGPVPDDTEAGFQAEIEQIFEKVDWNEGEFDPADKRYLVVQAGITETSRLRFARAVHDMHEDVVVVLSIGADTDPDRERFEVQLRDGHYVRMLPEIDPGQELHAGNAGRCMYRHFDIKQAG